MGGYDEVWYTCDEFREYLQNPGLPSKPNKYGWVFWNSKTKNDLIQCMMEEVTSSPSVSEYMVQLWGMKEGCCCCLTTVDQQFAVVGPLYKGYSLYRKLSEAHQYSFKEEFGAVGRAYINSSPESTPDLRLYSIQEFPLRNEAAQCSLRTYLAIPVFDLHTQKCYGVLEIVSPQIGEYSIFDTVDQGLKVAGLRSTHIGFTSITDPYKESTYHQPEIEISKMMKSALELVPQLHLLQLWSPCNQCVNATNNLSCMQRLAFMEAKDMKLNYCEITDRETYWYLEACEFHHLQIEKWLGGPPMSADRKSCFCRNICDFSICDNPLAHCAQRARLSFCFVVLLQNVHRSNNNYMLEFFFQSNSREDASFLHLLLKMMEMELTNFKFEKSIFELRKTSAPYAYEYVEWKHQDSHSHVEEVNLLTVMKGHREVYSLLDFKNYFDKNDLSCLQPYEKDKHGWLFGRDEMSNNGVNNNTAFQEKIIKLTTEMTDRLVWKAFSLVQFWAVGMDEGRPCLQTSHQPFALDSLHKGLAFFRKQCMERKYFVDEEVGPLQRVFRSGCPESSPDLRLYSTTEFPLRDHALHCHLRKYVAFPILDQHKRCIGVLECVGTDNSTLYADMIGFIMIEAALEASSLLTHINFMTDPIRQADGSRSLAKTEIQRALELIQNIPQLFQANAWVAYNECDGISGNISFRQMFGFHFPDIFKVYDMRQIKFHLVQPGKGIAGMALASENKLCFCRNLCNFGIADEPGAHHYQRNRFDVCFAICLHSSHTGDLQYVLQFFLHQCPTKYDEYLSYFLHILLPLLKQELTSFKVASGQQLGDNDLVVDVIEFSQGKQTTSSELDTSYSSPFKFRTVFYGQKEPQHSNDELPHAVPDVMDSVPPVPPAKPSNVAISDSREKGMAKEKVGRKRNGSLHIRLEDLEQHFGKKIEHVAQELGVARSTIKRACRSHGIDRWPSSEKYIKNRRLFEAAGTSQDNLSNKIPPPDMSLPPTNDKTSLQAVCDLQPDSETVIVKARYEDEIIKFELCRLSSSMKNLQEEVGRRLDLEIGSFKLRYLDEENEKILLACDDDLQLCFKSLTAGDKATVQVFVQLIPNK